MSICYLAPSSRSSELPASIAGFFVDPEKGALENSEALLKSPSNQGDFFSCAEKRAAMGVMPLKTAREREARVRLVKAAKSPTHEKRLESIAAKVKFLHEQECLKHCSYPAREPVEVERQRLNTPHKTAGCMSVIQYREWADEWRVRTQVDVTSGAVPEPQSGPRLSEMLSERAAKKIAESCEFMATKGGYKTFVTGTFSESARKKIELGETTIQREVSRAMDALQKMYQRGWVTEAGEKVPGVEPIYRMVKNRQGQEVKKLVNGLAYCWVVEIPKNEDGEDNPHVHMLLGWRVQYRHFEEWAKRVEKIWGNGYFHLEKIKDGLSAGAYMAKAAGYMTKAAGDESQGVVRGNRYGISESARAPGWVTVSKQQLHVMGQLIADVYDHLTVRYGEKFRERKELNKRLADTPKDAKALRKKIGERLQKVRADIKALPVRCNKYQVILKGQDAARAFFSWAKGEAVGPEWLPQELPPVAWEKGERVTLLDSHWFKKIQAAFRWMKRKRRAWCDFSLSQYVGLLIERKEGAEAENFAAWAEYEIVAG